MLRLSLRYASLDVITTLVFLSVVGVISSTVSDVLSICSTFWFSAGLSLASIKKKPKAFAFLGEVVV